MLLLDGPIPAGAHPGIQGYLGVYKRRPQDVNGRPSYVKSDEFVDDGEAKAIWFATDASRGREGWFIGLARNIGSSRSALAVNSSAKRPEEVSERAWECSRGGPRPWVAAPQIKAVEHPEWLRQGIDREQFRCVSPLRAAMRDAVASG